MKIQTVFKRYELKYMLTEEDLDCIKAVIAERMLPDEYGNTVIRNLYFDTASYRLIRRSIDKPPYKEKLRIRSYHRTEPTDTVFVELKKKYKHVVYKRRLPLEEADATRWLSGEPFCGKSSQISREIDYFLNFYGELRPRVFLSYEREAYYGREEGDLRITFDRNVLARLTDLTLDSEVYGEPLLCEGRILMEVKCAGGLPLWLTHVLSERKIYKTSFSKYGTAYEKLIYPTLSGKITDKEQFYVD